MAYKWGTIIPLAGGMSIGLEKAFGYQPSNVFSFPGFQANDGHYLQYRPDVPYHIIGESEGSIPTKGSINVINSVCPCAGLSMLNTGGGKNSTMGRGSDAAQNEHMYNSSRWVLENLEPDVLWGENAPGLYTNIGAGVRVKLHEIAKEFGYAFSIIKTNTRHHGVPQNRPRTFYFFWKAESAPILEYYDRPTKNLGDYLKEIPKSASYQDNNEKLTEDLANDWTYRWAKDKYGDEFREVIGSKSKTVFGYVAKFDLLEDLCAFAEKIQDPKALKVTAHMRKKFSQGLGIWDSSIHIFDPKSEINAVIGRNMADSIHPFEDRFMNIREYLHLMGHPHDYELTDRKHAHHLTQNVPVNTARDWTYEVIKFLDGKLSLSGVDYLLQDNTKQRIDTDGIEVIDPSTAGFIMDCM